MKITPETDSFSKYFYPNFTVLFFACRIISKFSVCTHSSESALTYDFPPQSRGRDVFSKISINKQRNFQEPRSPNLKIFTFFLRISYLYSLWFSSIHVVQVQQVVFTLNLHNLLKFHIPVFIALTLFCSDHQNGFDVIIFQQLNVKPEQRMFCICCNVIFGVFDAE